MSLAVGPHKRKRNHPHPYLSGNFAPVHQTLPLTGCSYSGVIPEELYGGEYVRNGGNPVANEDLGRDAHWFDGDGMLSGVAFTRTNDGVRPEFVNQFILTDVYLSTNSSPFLHRPILPSLATLASPLSTLYTIVLHVFRALALVILSRLPGSSQPIKRISVANTGILFHDGRALATCESGPPMRVMLPGLETVGWFSGKAAEGEMITEEGSGFGGDGILRFMKEWTTAHPRVDLKTEELVLFHSTFVSPYVHYSVIPASHPPSTPSIPHERPTRLLNAPIPGISSPKMMHDFGVSFDHTVIMDLPLSLNPLNLVRHKAAVSYDPSAKSRFGIFPRYEPEEVRWFETKACCIFHTANTWDDSYVDQQTGNKHTQAVNMLACRLTSPSVIFSAGDIAAPRLVKPVHGHEEEQCRLYYYRFAMDKQSSRNCIAFQFALSAIPFEFPSTREDRAMSEAEFIYGCSTSTGSFSAALGRVAKIDCLVKINSKELIRRGKKDITVEPVTGCVDRRSIGEVLSSLDPHDPISVFKLPDGLYAQEPRFVPRRDGTSEDDGWLLTYVFDESQLDANGECLPTARSELWIVDAKDMQTVVGKVQLPMRVTYGFHGSFISEQKILTQRPVETIRGIKQKRTVTETSWLWSHVRKRIEHWVG